MGASERRVFDESPVFLLVRQVESLGNDVTQMLIVKVTIAHSLCLRSLAIHCWPAFLHDILACKYADPFKWFFFIPPVARRRAETLNMLSY
jgi:hypothetical protein